MNPSQESTDVRDASGWLASQYNENAPFVYSAAFTSSVLELLSARPGEKIFDFGCGSGEVTLELRKIVEQGEGGMVIGVDMSDSMVGVH
jgi:ubiquinone/menaquinone biosynthesis C-methylase UbiE